MSDNPKGKDGVARLFARMKLEYKEIRRVLKEQKGSHDPYTNFFVESCRHGPYLVGHILAWTVPLIIIGLIL